MIRFDLNSLEDWGQRGGEGGGGGKGNGGLKEGSGILYFGVE